jgi:hypothetical protein
LSVTLPRMVPFAPPWPYSQLAETTTNKHANTLRNLMVSSSLLFPERFYPPSHLQVHPGGQT